ncbi:MAG: polyprenol monophosphomannose synthase [Candidatus Taylorbacteria bacterium]|nr:polyprenol monophosphomannose synthase [Candidatus Taylorbacteria bacterium]
MKRVIIIPTYNEAENIRGLLSEIRTLLPEVSVVVVDDSSPDGTGDVIRAYAATDTFVSLLSRPEKDGLGKAYLFAFEHILKDGEVSELFMMDADFSHNPKYLPSFFQALAQYDVVVGSRYVSGGGIAGWELWRKWLSYFGNLYCRILLRLPVLDATSGFYALRADVLRKLDFQSIDASGYAFQIEFKYLLHKQKARFKEFPIVFANRAGGESKMSGHIISEGIGAPWKMLWKR